MIPSYVFDESNKIRFTGHNIRIDDSKTKDYTLLPDNVGSVDLYIPSGISNQDVMLFNEVDGEGFQLTSLLQQNINYSNESVLKYHSTSNSRIYLKYNLVPYKHSDGDTIRSIIKFFVDRTIHDTIEIQGNKTFKIVKLYITSDKDVFPSYILDNLLLFYVENIVVNTVPLTLSKKGEILFRELDVTLLLIPNINRNVSEQVVIKS